MEEEFDDWDSCSRTHQELCDSTFSPLFSIKRSETVEQYNRKSDRKKKLNSKLKYASIMYTCVHYGNYVSKATDKRPNTKTAKSGCKAFIKYAASAALQKLLVRGKNLTHNHALSAEDYQSYPQQRAIRNLSDEKKMEVITLLQLGIDTKEILEKVITESNRIEIPKGLHNLKTKAISQSKETTGPQVLAILTDQVTENSLDLNSYNEEGQVLTFENFDDFLIWKKELEKSASGTKDKKSGVVENDKYTADEELNAAVNSLETDVIISNEEQKHHTTKTNVVYLCESNESLANSHRKEDLKEKKDTSPPKIRGNLSPKQDKSGLQKMSNKKDTPKEAVSFNHSLASVACMKENTKTSCVISAVKSSTVCTKTQIDDCTLTTTSPQIKITSKSSESTPSNSVITKGGTTNGQVLILNTLLQKNGAQNPLLSPTGAKNLSSNLTIKQNSSKPDETVPSKNAQGYTSQTSKQLSEKENTSSVQNVVTIAQKLHSSVLQTKSIPSEKSFFKKQKVTEKIQSPISTTTVSSVTPKELINSAKTVSKSTQSIITISSPLNVKNFSESTAKNTSNTLVINPALLNSMPSGQTFMAINNNLIPIATSAQPFSPLNVKSNFVLTSNLSPSPVMKNHSILKINTIPAKIIPATKLSSPASNLIKMEKKLKSTSSKETSKIKNSVQIKSFMQTKCPLDGDDVEILKFKKRKKELKLRRKEKVKYFQMEMKYLAAQAECKRLKLELAKAQMKNQTVLNEEDKLSARVQLDKQVLHEENKANQECNKLNTVEYINIVVQSESGGQQLIDTAVEQVEGEHQRCKENVIRNSYPLRMDKSESNGNQVMGNTSLVESVDISISGEEQIIGNIILDGTVDEQN